MTAERCIDCKAELNFDPADDLDYPHEIGESGNYWCRTCWKRVDDERDEQLERLRDELERETAGKSFYRTIVAVELTADEYHCHSNLCHRLVASDATDPNPIYLVESKHDTRLRTCCSLKCALIYAEEETESEDEEEQ